MLAWFDIILVFIFLALNDDVRIMLNVTVCHTSTPGAGYTADGGLDTSLSIPKSCVLARSC